MNVTIDSGKPEPIKWPTREEWARERRSAYGNKFDNLDTGFRISAEERQAIVASLGERWKEEGRKLRSAPRVLWEQRAEHRSNRKVIRRILKGIAQGDWRYALICDEEVRPAVLDAVIRRHDAAYWEAHNRRCAEILATPIDDAAWECELHRRRALKIL